jgi:acetyltransferase-like isoleucine patch superfamily enzyme
MEMTASFKRSLKPTLKVVITEFYRRYRQTLDRAAVISFTRTVQVVGPGCKVFHPVYLRNPQYVRIGTDFYAGPGLRIEAWDRFQGNQYSPEIIIGNHVAVDYHVHLRAIGRIEIGDNVFIGSHVLITDYSHGQFTHEELEILAPLRPLVSKGPVVIEDNVRIGEGACILSGVRIGRNAVIRANAVVTHNVEPGQTERSVPAQVMGSKNK